MRLSLIAIPGRTPTSPSTGLTLKQEAFAQAVADGMNQSAAYRTAFRADGMAPATVRREACLLAKAPKVAARVEGLRQRNVRRVLRERAKREAYVLDERRRIA